MDEHARRCKEVRDVMGHWVEPGVAAEVYKLSAGSPVWMRRIYPRVKDAYDLRDQEWEDSLGDDL